MLIKTNKHAGFFIRFASLLIDVIIFSIIGISFSLICISSKELNFGTQNITLHLVTKPWAYYVWLLILIVVLIIQFVMIPFLNKGRTLGMTITRLKFINTNSETKLKVAILKKIQIGVLLWILLIITFLIFVNEKIVNKVTLYSKVRSFSNDFFTNWSMEEKQQLVSSYKLTIVETAFITVPATISSITIFGQLFMLISVGINKQKVGIMDRLTNSLIVYQNHFVEKNVKTLSIIKPIKYSKPEILWKE